MKLHELVKPLDEQTDEELIERLRQIRHRRHVERPAVKKRQADADVVKKGRATRKSGTQLDKILSALTDEQRAALIEQLKSAGGAGGNSGKDEGSSPGQDSDGGQVQD
jgi:hypothetical protein